MTGIITVGWLLDSGMDANPAFKVRLSQWLRQNVAKEPKAWLHSTNQTFLQWFDKIYSGSSSRLELAVWIGLFLSPVTLAFQRVGFGIGSLQAAELLIVAILVAFAYAAIAFGAIVTDNIGAVFACIFGVIVGGIFAGLFGVSGGAVGGVIFGVIFSGVFGVGGFIGGAIIEMGIRDQTNRWAITGLVLGLIIGGIFGAVGGAIIVGGIDAGIVGTVIFGSIFGGIFGGIVAVFGVDELGDRESTGGINPLKAMLWSEAFLCVIGCLVQDTGRSFVNAIYADPKVLAFVAFNVFADGVSLLETRWVLQRGATGSLKVLAGLVVLDLVASGLIYLILPTILWPQLLEFWDAVRFQGERPWLGILFWTTFSTSVLFYLFVAAALMVRPLAWGFSWFGWLSRPFDLEAHPVKCLAVAMALVVTVLFSVVGIIQFV
ncbi:MAG TPA: hypothetical protein EYM54_03005 [Dehalococcoidia bacterium]|nr:hypothetical protein [Dehalococcoidia bacterium]